MLRENSELGAAQQERRGLCSQELARRLPEPQSPRCPVEARQALSRPFLEPPRGEMRLRSLRAPCLEPHHEDTRLVLFQHLLTVGSTSCRVAKGRRRKLCPETESGAEDRSQPLPA